MEMLTIKSTTGVLFLGLFTEITTETLKDILDYELGNDNYYKGVSPIENIDVYVMRSNPDTRLIIEAITVDTEYRRYL